MLQRSVQLVCLQLTATVAVALQANIPSLESGWKSEGSHMIQWQPQEDDTATMEISITFPNVSQYSLANNAKEQDGFLIYSPNETLPEGTYRLDFSRSNLPLVNINFNVEAGEEDAIAEHPFVSAASGGGGGGRSSSGSSGSGGRSGSNSSGRNGRNTPGNNANPAGWSEPSDESDNKSVAGGAKAGSSGGTVPAQSSTGQTTVRSITSGVPSAIVRPITTGVKYNNRTSTATEKMVIPVAIPLLSVVLGATI
ncbi:uncharacterized protein L203_103956 [Cryptococcus depauperatus CBS 7841]|uniref:Uncharacterized protein n=1 Tax=Cryptococcus depauperatus CBS 7841 TaxID=1295531 RepID=A0A1E3HS79_9TREE|nr:hypothetical protein L203_06015 [Cryptococcus depauperatus CBS 7841]